MLPIVHSLTKQGLKVKRKMRVWGKEKGGRVQKSIKKNAGANVKENITAGVKYVFSQNIIYKMNIGQNIARI